MQLLVEDRLDCVFFTQQRPAYLDPFLYSVLKLKIPGSIFIFSWDNLSSKGRKLGAFDYFLVWSDSMKEELLHFYSTVKPGNIKVVGTPQFESYIMDSYPTDRAGFLKKFNLDENTKIIF